MYGSDAERLLVTLETPVDLLGLRDEGAGCLAQVGAASRRVTSISMFDEVSPDDAAETAIVPSFLIAFIFEVTVASSLSWSAFGEVVTL